MITLTTLQQATAQQVFNQVATHLLTQMEKSEDETMCRYRLGNLKCAAGCLISDEEYKLKMENNDWESLLSQDVIPTWKHDELINQLQTVHDGYNPPKWRDKLEDIAIRHGLQFNKNNE